MSEPMTSEKESAIQAAFDKGLRVQCFWQENLHRFLPDFEGKHIAVDLTTGSVVASHVDLVFLVYDLRDKCIDRDTVAIHHISARSERIHA